MKQNTSKLAAMVENDNNDVARAVSEWEGSDIAALVKDGGNIGPVSRLGDVVNINDFDAAEYVLVEVNIR